MTREKAAKEIVIWNKAGSNSEEARIDGYVLVADNLGGGKFAWEAWFNSEIVAMGNINGDCNTMKMAKDKACYRMRKHKKSLRLKQSI